MYPSREFVTRTSSPTFNRPIQAVQKFSSASMTVPSYNFTLAVMTGTGAISCPGSVNEIRTPRFPRAALKTSAAKKTMTRKTSVACSRVITKTLFEALVLSPLCSGCRRIAGTLLRDDQGLESLLAPDLNPSIAVISDIKVFASANNPCRSAELS
jgi:hypothetical protein